MSVLDSFFGSEYAVDLQNTTQRGDNDAADDDHGSLMREILSDTLRPFLTPKGIFLF